MWTECGIRHLVDKSMGHQGSKTFPRHAPLIFTTAPSCDTWPLKKADEHHFKGKDNHGHPGRGKRGDLIDGLFWDNAENMLPINQGTCPEEILMVSFPIDHQSDQTAVSKAETQELQHQVEQLEKKLQEKVSQVQGAECAQKTEVIKLQAKVEELQKQVWEKEHDIKKGQDQLSEKQQELVGLCTLLKKAEVAVQASNMKAANMEYKLHGLGCYVATLFSQMQDTLSSYDDEQVFELENSTISAGLSEDMRGMDSLTTSQAHQLDTQHLELTRRKYLAALIAARENPGEGLLYLIAELRSELQAFVMHPAANLLAVRPSRSSSAKVWPS